MLLAALALGLPIAACGGDDDKSETTTVSESTTAAAIVLPAHEVAKKDGARAHSEAEVYECSSMDVEGDVGSAAFGGFQDISVRGISCETGRERILAVDKTYDGKSVAEEVDGYDCSVIDELADGLNTIRCVTRPPSIGRTENSGLVRIAAVMNGSPSKTISKMSGGRPAADTSK